MQNGFAELRRAIRVDAAVVDLAFGAHNLRAAHGASLRHVKDFVAARMLFVVDDFDDLRNHVAAAFHLHPVADLHAQALDFIQVVQRGIPHRRAAD